MSVKRDEFIAKMKSHLDELNLKIDALEARAHEAKEEARQAYRAELAKARHESKLAQSKFEEMKAAGEESWDRMVREMEKVRDAFVHSFRYFKSQL